MQTVKLTKMRELETAIQAKWEAVHAFEVDAPPVRALLCILPAGEAP